MDWHRNIFSHFMPRKPDINPTRWVIYSLRTDFTFYIISFENDSTSCLCSEKEITTTANSIFKIVKVHWNPTVYGLHQSQLHSRYFECLIYSPGEDVDALIQASLHGMTSSSGSPHQHSRRKRRSNDLDSGDEEEDDEEGSEGSDTGGVGASEEPEEVSPEGSAAD